MGEVDPAFARDHGNQPLVFVALFEPPDCFLRLSVPCAAKCIHSFEFCLPQRPILAGEAADHPAEKPVFQKAGALFLLQHLPVDTALHQSPRHRRCGNDPAEIAGKRSFLKIAADHFYPAAIFVYLHVGVAASRS